MKELFQTEEDAKAGIANFTALKQTVGWQTVVEMLNNDIEILKKIILEGELPEDELNLKREALKVYQSVVDLPDKWIEKLQTPPAVVEEADPYYTVDTLKEERFKRSQE